VSFETRRRGFVLDAAFLRRCRTVTPPLSASGDSPGESWDHAASPTLFVTFLFQVLRAHGVPAARSTFQVSPWLPPTPGTEKGHPHSKSLLPRIFTVLFFHSLPLMREGEGKSPSRRCGPTCKCTHAVEMSPPSYLGHFAQPSPLYPAPKRTRPRLHAQSSSLCSRVFVWREECEPQWCYGYGLELMRRGSLPG